MIEGMEKDKWRKGMEGNIILFAAIQKVIIIFVSLFKMQRFMEHVRQPSNLEDFAAIFDSEAKFKPTRPQQAERKLYFNRTLQDIMRKFISYLIKQDLVQAKSEQQVVSKIDKKQIQFGDLIIHFTTWLDLDDTIFIYNYESKPKPTSIPKTIPTKPYPTNEIAQIQAPQKSYTHKPPPAERIPINQTKRDVGSGPYIIQKVIPTVFQSTHPRVPQTHHTPPPQPKSSAMGYQQQKKHGQGLYPTPYHANIPSDNKDFKLRLIEKLADYFEYPQRSASIKIDITSLFAYRKG